MVKSSAPWMREGRKPKVYSIKAQEGTELSVEEAHIIYDYGELSWGDEVGVPVYDDNYGVVALSTQALQEAQRIVKCTGAVCAGVVVRYVLAGPGILKCVMAGCVGAGVACIIGALLS